MDGAERESGVGGRRDSEQRSQRIFAILVFSGYLIRRSQAAKKLNLPPEASGAWPIIGHLHLMGGGNSKLPHITLGKLADTYGPIFSIRLGTNHAVVVSSSELAKEIFTTNDVAVISRPETVSSKLLGYNDAMLGFAPRGPYWREIRKIATLKLLSNRRLEILNHVRAFEVEASIKAFYKLWNEKKDSSGGRLLIEMKHWFGDVTLNIILRMVVGKRYFDYSGESDELEKRKCQKVVRDFFHYVGLFVVRDALPYLGWLDIGGHEKAMKKTFKELDTLADEWLDEHRRKRASGETDGEQDFMDVMLTLFEGRKVAGFDSDTVNKATSISMIAGGTDAVGVTLTWALSLILNNPHVLRKAHEELDIHIGKERLIKESDIGKLVYFQAICKEVLRLRPPSSLIGHRQFTEECTVGGYHIPKGTRLMVNLWKIQNDPLVWPNPEEFNPERFLTTHKDVDVRGHHFELIPFSAGRRACPGISFGLQLLQFVLANFLHAFNISTPLDAPVDMSETFGLINVKATPLEVLVTPRLSPSVYE